MNDRTLVRTHVREEGETGASPERCASQRIQGVQLNALSQSMCGHYESTTPCPPYPDQSPNRFGGVFRDTLALFVHEREF